MPKPKPEFVIYLEEVFAPLGSIDTSRLFGGWTLRADGRPFAFVVREELYFRADPPLRAALAAAGSQPFRYQKISGPVTIARFMSAPEADLDDADALVRWAIQALG